jgi:glutamate/tyrosine decarboxylase-like PLP-dependent enzyme
MANAGTTVRGCYDNFREMHEVTKRHNQWLHIDGAWGGAILTSPTHKHLMDGSELADSMCWDAHKMMGMPMICSAFMIQDPSILKHVCAHGKTAHYLLHKDAEDVDLGHSSL